MYKVLSIQDDVMTRQIKLENIITGTVDVCFDDSGLVEERNFEFMELQKQYQCKIKLFGEIVEQKEDAILCNIIDKDIFVGKKSMIKVLVCSDEYYLPVDNVMDVINGDWFYYKISRKDLIQVNDIVHGDYL